MILCCEGCGESLDVPGLSIDEAPAYIDKYFVNTGYAILNQPETVDDCAEFCADQPNPKH